MAKRPKWTVDRERLIVAIEAFADDLDMPVEYFEVFTRVLLSVLDNLPGLVEHDIRAFRNSKHG